VLVHRVEVVYSPPTRFRADVDTRAKRGPRPVAVDVLGTTLDRHMEGLPLPVAVADAGPQLEWADSDVDDLIREANHPSPVLTHLDEILAGLRVTEIGRRSREGSVLPPHSHQETAARKSAASRSNAQRSVSASLASGPTTRMVMRRV